MKTLVAAAGLDGGDGVEARRAERWKIIIHPTMCHHILVLNQVEAGKCWQEVQNQRKKVVKRPAVCVSAPRSLRSIILEEKS